MLLQEKDLTMPKGKDEKDNDHDNYLQKFTVAVFGDSAVGKTSLINRLVGIDFSFEHEPTVEDFHVKHLAFKNKKCELQIIDTSGTYEFPAMRRVDMEKSDAVVLVYSMDRPESFSKLERYMEEVRECSIATKDFDKPIIVVSNKTDLPNLTEPKFLDKRGLNVSVGMHLEAKYGCHWFDASAKLDDNVEDTFHRVLDYLLKKCAKEKAHRAPARRISSMLQRKMKVSR